MGGGTERVRMPQSVLVVEDNVIILMDAEDVIKELGVAEVWTATSADEALAVLERSSPQCALLDVDLGTGTSFAVASSLKAKGIAFAFVTGYGDNLSAPAEFAGVPRLLKPHSEQALRDVLEQLAE